MPNKSAQEALKNLGIKPKAKKANREPSLAERAKIVEEAANKYHISPEILWGVYGIETDHGALVNTSSTGAKGSFQFMPENWTKYNYPGTNSKDTATFRAQAFAAAHLLSDNLKGAKRTPGAYNVALKVYNSGNATAGYGFREVRARGRSWASIMNGAAANQAEKEVGYGSVGATVAETVEGKNPLKTSAELIEAVAEPHTWVRIVEVVGGVALLYLGLHSMIVATRPTVIGEAAGEVNKATLKLKGVTKVASPAGIAANAVTKTAKKTAKGGKRVRAAKAAHSRSMKFGGTKAQARAAAARAANNPKGK